jgi:ADP-dependent NAD(P)H-hydrate dehydratase / NAD(P)H-hydrate epimerase
MRILTASQMREADRLTVERDGIPSLTLMENAGAGVVEVLQREIPNLSQQRILLLCGKGNNGGDGFVVARLLKRLGAEPTVVLLAGIDAMRGDAALNLERWRAEGGTVRTIASEASWTAEEDELLSGAELIVDAVLGTGLNGPATGLFARVIADVNERSNKRPKTKVMSVDIPSGLSSDAASNGGPVIRADWTVTFTAPKVGLLLSPDCENAGSLTVHSIGTPRAVVEQMDSVGADLHWLEPGEFRQFALRRRVDSNKGTYGHALIVAGARGKAGAAALSGWAALRVGAGLVTVATPKEALPVVASYTPELMTEELLQTEAGTVSLRNFEYNKFAELTKGKSVLGLGPGLSMQDETQQFVRRTVAECPLRIVLDADGLNALAAVREPILRRAAPVLALTPHPGEMARLLRSTVREVQADRLGAAQSAAKKYNAFVILKGFHTIVAAPGGRVFVNSTGNPGMATAGTGDVLTGMLAGLTSQFGIENWEAVLGLGVYLHGLAGDIAYREMREAPLMATDLIARIPHALAQLRGELDDGD